MITAFCRVIDAAAHLDRNGDFRRYDIARSSNDLQGHAGLPQMKTAATASQHFLDWATEIDVDEVGGDRIDQLLGTVEDPGDAELAGELGGLAGDGGVGVGAGGAALEEAARFGKYLITGAAVTGAAAVLLFVFNRSKAPTRERADTDRVIDVDAVEVP